MMKTLTTLTAAATLVAALAVAPTDANAQRRWGPAVGLGILGGVAQLAFTRAFRLAPAAVISPFDYTGLLYAAVIGYAVWGDVPTLPFLIGAAIVIASGLYILHRETRLGRDI